MRLLVLGGTEFVGRAVVDAGLARGAQVTVFNRGRTAPPPGVNALVGDRLAAGGLEALAGAQEWDVVVDTWSAAPWVVRDAARVLAGRAGGYAYVSSRSVHVYPPAEGATEEAPVVESTPEEGEDGAEVEYSQAKRGGELAAERYFGERALFVRAGLILGPHENIGRLPWWLRRIARGGPVLAPGPEDLDVQYVDARDLAGWTLDAAERGLGGPFNLVGPPGQTTMGEILQTCVEVTGSDAELRWTAPEPILVAGIEPWMDLPIWIPPGAEHDGIHRSDVTKALNAGLRVRPVGETIADTWAWLETVDGVPIRPDRPFVGLDPEREAAVLAG